MKKRTAFLGLLVASLAASPGLWSRTNQDKDRAELAKAVAEAKVSLGQALSASTSEGKPISGKFEVEEGKLQLSVYTAKGDKFSEVIVDNNTGKAKAQSEAMAKAKQSLRAPLAKVLKGNPGFRAVSVFPSLKDGHPMAEVTLTKGDEWKTVSEKLE